MARAKCLNNVAVIFAALVGVLNEQRNGRSGCQTLVHARQNLNRVGFVALSDKFGSTRPAAIQIGLDVRLRKRHAGWATVDHAANGWAVGFTKVGD